MAMHKPKYTLFISISTAIILGLTFLITGYVSNEGFNPSDDGVILAQSYRIINGEIPHTDFISIRPVFSGILHTIHFSSPLPIIISGRYFALIEYYIYSVLWVSLLLLFFIEGTRKDYFHIFLPLVIAAFLLNLNTYHLYPWTTIDGILFSMLGIFFFFKTLNQTISFRSYIFYIIALICVSLGALAKQSFVFPAIFIFAMVIREMTKAKKFKLMPLIIISGALPFLAYFVFLLINQNLPDFLQQMSGRTEFFKTAIIRYGVSFVQSKIIVLNVLSLFILLLDFYSRTSGDKTLKGWRSFLTFNNPHFLKIVISIYLVLTIFLSYWFILNNNYHSLPFEFFWMLAIVLCISIYKRFISKRQLLLCTAGLLLAWSSSISLGANSPVYTCGLLVSCQVILIYNIFKKTAVFPLKLEFRLFLYVSILILMHGFFFASNYGQSKYNYRELSAKHLNKELKSIIPEFGNIKTNSNTYDYYSDFFKIYNDLDLKGRFALLPNNAIIYPLLDSKNPFPLDWMQRDEFIGSEEHLIRALTNIIATQDIYLVIDRYDSKEMATGFKIKNYDEINYPYMRIIKERCTKIPVESNYFDVYKSGSSNEK